MLRPRLLAFLLFLLLLSNESVAQQRGVVADAASHAPLSYVSIYSSGSTKIGTYSNFDGEFTLPVNLQSDTVVFSLLGYRSHFQELEKIFSTDTIFLYEEPLQLAAIEVKAEKKVKTRMGPSSSSGNLRVGSNLASWYSELAVFFKANSVTPLYVDSIELYLLLQDKNSKGGYARVNLYTVGNNMFPSDPLINRSFLVKAQAPHWRGKWYSIDVSDFLLMMPENGLFVSVEFLPTMESDVTSKNTSIRFGKKYPLKTFERIAGNGWRHAIIQKIKPDYSPLIRLNLSN